MRPPSSGYPPRSNPNSPRQPNVLVNLKREPVQLLRKTHFGRVHPLAELNIRRTFPPRGVISVRVRHRHRQVRQVPGSA